MYLGTTNFTKFLEKNYLNALVEKRSGLYKKYYNSIGSIKKDTDDKDEKVNADTKQVILEIQSTEQQIQEALYEEKSRKLELERMKLEEAAAKNFREREKAFARHEGKLLAASMNKLFCAMGNYSQFRIMAEKGGQITIKDMADSGSDSYLSHNLLDKAEDINRDIRESVEYEKAAAEVARRRKKERLKKSR